MKIQVQISWVGQSTNFISPCSTFLSRTVHTRARQTLQNGCLNMGEKIIKKGICSYQRYGMSLIIMKWVFQIPIWLIISMARTNAQGGSQLCSTWGGKLQHRTGKPTLHRSQTLPLQYRSDECSSSARVGDTNLDTKNLQKGYKNRQTKLILNQMLSHLFQGEPNWAQQTTIPFSWISVVTFRDGLRSKQ